MNTKQDHKYLQLALLAIAAEILFSQSVYAQMFPLPPDWKKHSVTYVYIAQDGSEDIEYKDNPDVAPESHVLVMPLGERYVAIGDHVWDDTTNELQYEMRRLQAEITAAQHEIDSCTKNHVTPHYPAYTFDCRSHGAGSACTFEDLHDRIDEFNEDLVAMKAKYDRLDAILNNPLLVKN
jgi:hypothetical protein